MNTQTNPMYEMELHDAVTLEGPQATAILRVPGGWIYTFWTENGTGGYDQSSAFVPFNNEFQDEQVQ